MARDWILERIEREWLFRVGLGCLHVVVVPCQAGNRELGSSVRIDLAGRERIDGIRISFDGNDLIRGNVGLFGKLLFTGPGDDTEPYIGVVGYIRVAAQVVGIAGEYQQAFAITGVWTREQRFFTTFRQDCLTGGNHIHHAGVDGVYELAKWHHRPLDVCEAHGLEPRYGGFRTKAFGFTFVRHVAVRHFVGHRDTDIATFLDLVRRDRGGCSDHADQQQADDGHDCDGPAALRISHCTLLSRLDGCGTRPGAVPVVCVNRTVSRYHGATLANAIRPRGMENLFVLCYAL